MRFNERAAAEAAFRAGVSPEIVHSEPGILVMRFVEGRTLAAEDVRDPARLERIVSLVRKVHVEMPRYLRGPLLAFWVFHVIRDYAHTLTEGNSPYIPRLEPLLALAERLKYAVGSVDLVFGHNDLLPANFIDDGSRIWLIDWDYAGWNSPLFDLANLASNTGFPPAEELRLLAAYFGREPEAGLVRSFRAMKCASLLREAMWSMVSEIHSTLDFDYASYTADYLGRLDTALAEFEQGQE
jgi:thiamine kinase-like enzyme